MKYTNFETLFIDVITRDIVGEKTVVRYIDENDDIKKLEISKVDYDILPNQKLLVSKVDDIVLAYYKNKKDILNYTVSLQNDIYYHKSKPQDSIFIISDENDINELKKSQMKARLPPFLALLSLIGTIAVYILYMLWDKGWLQFFLLFIPVILGYSSFVLYQTDSFTNDNTINRKYEELYNKFILDFEQSLADNKHKF